MSFDLALVDSDISIKTDGSMRTIENSDKLRQDIIKIILTPLGSVRFHPWYGSSINDGVIGEVLPDSMLFQDISSALLLSLDRLKTLQRAQSTGQRVSMAEMLGLVRDISVQRNPIDPRQVNVLVFAISKDFNSVQETFTIS